MKKIIKIIPLLLLFTIMLVSCGRNKQDEKKKISLDGNDVMDVTQTYFSSGRKAIAKAEDGYYFVDESKIPQPLAYYDNASGKSVYLCDLPNCNHVYDPRTGTDCKAYITGYACNYLMYCDGTLYAICSDNNKVDLFAMDKDGNNRRLISTLLYAEAFPEMVIYNGFVYYGELSNNTTSEESEISILRMSLSGGNQEKIYTITGDNPSFSQFKIYGNNLYFTQSVGSINFAKQENNIKIDGLYRINLDNNEAVKVIDEPIFRYAIDMKDKRIFYSVEGKGLFCYDAEADKTETFYESTEQFDRINITYDGEHLYADNTVWLTYAYVMYGYTATSYDLIVMNPDGSLVNQIELPKTTSYTFGGDKTSFFISTFDDKGSKIMCVPKDSIVNKKEVVFKDFTIDRE